MHYNDGTCGTCKHLSTKRSKMTGNCLCTKGGIVLEIMDLDSGCVWYDYFKPIPLNAEQRKEQK